VPLGQALAQAVELDLHDLLQVLLESAWKTMISSTRLRNSGAEMMRAVPL
jgi:hypothetical protein